MESKTFLQYGPGSPTTVKEIKRIHSVTSAPNFFGLFAYATQSGVAAFDLSLGTGFWRRTGSRWLFGIDYGRTQPRALRSMCSKDNSKVRIFDGAWLVNQKGFIPRRDFHTKMALMLNPTASLYGAVIGSGNFSSNGLQKSVEGGATYLLKDKKTFAHVLEQTVVAANDAWKHATPALEILDEYESRWSSAFLQNPKDGENEEAGDQEALPEAAEVFWIEAGYVTRNRGPDKPGNQIDFPRNSTARYFGFKPKKQMAPNSVIGPVTFRTPVGEPVVNNLRLGNNMMEKISLPIPETHGFDIYDGKVLVFRRSGSRFHLETMEATDFETAFGWRVRDVRLMGSGRRYGFILK